MQNHTDKSYVYCTPYLDEIKRIRDACGRWRFKEPIPNESSKIDNFNKLLASGTDIAVTHATLLNATEKTINNIQEGEYTLILDETIDVIQEYNDLSSVKEAHQALNDTNIKSILLEKGFISIGEDNKVTWTERKHNDDFQYSEFERLASLGRVYCISRRCMLVVLPIELFRAFKEVYVLTYQFDGSLLQHYFDFFRLDYEINFDHEADRLFREKCRRLITLHGGEKDKRNYLSSHWYDGATKKDIRAVKKKLENYYGNTLRRTGYKVDDAMWTCPKKRELDLCGKGYTRRDLTEEERARPKEEQEVIRQEKTLRFVPCNARATNDYKDRWALAYCCNMNYNPMIKRFFTDWNEQRRKDGLPVIEPNNDKFALSSLIQWIYRSRIRDDKEIHLLIVSKRIYDLFVDWINGVDLQSSAS